MREGRLDQRFLLPLQYLKLGGERGQLLLLIRRRHRLAIRQRINHFIEPFHHRIRMRPSEQARNAKERACVGARRTAVACAAKSPVLIRLKAAKTTSDQIAEAQWLAREWKPQRSSRYLCASAASSSDS